MYICKLRSEHRKADITTHVNARYAMHNTEIGQRGRTVDAAELMCV